MAENQAYALVRIAPAFFSTNLPVLLLCVVSYLIEAVAILLEQTFYHAPPNSMLPQTLMAVFASIVTCKAEPLSIPLYHPFLHMSFPSPPSLAHACTHRLLGQTRRRDDERRWLHQGRGPEAAARHASHMRALLGLLPPGRKGSSWQRQKQKVKPEPLTSTLPWSTRHLSVSGKIMRCLSVRHCSHPVRSRQQTFSNLLLHCKLLRLHDPCFVVAHNYIFEDLSVHWIQ